MSSEVRYGSKPASGVEGYRQSNGTPVTGIHKLQETRYESSLDSVKKESTTSSSEGRCSWFKRCCDCLLAPFYALWNLIKRCFSSEKSESAPSSARSEPTPGAASPGRQVPPRVEGKDNSPLRRIFDMNKIKDAQLIEKLENDPVSTFRKVLCWALSQDEHTIDQLFNHHFAREKASVINALTIALFKVCNFEDCGDNNFKVPQALRSLFYEIDNLERDSNAQPSAFFSLYIKMLIAASEEENCPVDIINSLIPSIESRWKRETSEQARPASRTQLLENLYNAPNRFKTALNQRGSEMLREFLAEIIGQPTLLREWYTAFSHAAKQSNLHLYILQSLDQNHIIWQLFTNDRLKMRFQTFCKSYSHDDLKRFGEEFIKALNNYSNFNSVIRDLTLRFTAGEDDELMREFTAIVREIREE